jgi:hypothetical protein
MFKGRTSMSAIKTFPDFTALDISHKRAYEELAGEFPPYSDLSFSTLLTWWNFLESCRVSTLNGNLVIAYWFPGIEKYSGLSIVGKHDVDHSICEIFDYLGERNEPMRLVHVPEMVIREMRYPAQFKFKEERGFDEYIVPVERFYPLDGAQFYRKYAVKRFMAKIEDSRIVTKSIDLSDESNRQLLLAKTNSWWKKGSINDLLKLEQEALVTSIKMGSQLGIKNMCLYIDGELQGFCLYQLPQDQRYAIIAHIKVSTEMPHAFEYMAYVVACWFAHRNIQYVNLEYDLGLPLLRVIKLALGPTTYLRKYTIEPV